MHADIKNHTDILLVPVTEDRAFSSYSAMLTLLAVTTLLSPQFTSEISVGFASHVAKAPPISLSKPKPFDISFFNGTKKKVMLLTEQCSWGYEMLRFEISNPAGKIYKVNRKIKAWNKNAPTPLEIESTGLKIRKVDLGDGTWVGIPSGSGSKVDGWFMRVILKLPKDKVLVDRGIWAGSISSKWVDAKK